MIHRQPDSDLQNHYSLYLSIINELKIPHPHANQSTLDFDALFTSSVEEMRSSGCRNAIISEERLSQVTRGISQQMGRYRQYFDAIKVVAYIRRQDYFFESLFSQLVKKDNITMPLKEFIQLPKIQKRGDYEMILDWWAEEFGRENIIIAPFEVNTIQPNPIAYFFQCLGLPSAILNTFPLEEKRYHVSPPREVTEYFRHLNLNETVFNVRVLKEYLQESGGNITNNKYFCREDREEILQRYEESNSAVARKYLQRDDGILFEEPVVDFPNCPETWEGLSSKELVDFVLPISGKMSVEISRLHSENIRLKKRNAHLDAMNAQLINENRRLGNLKKTVYRFLQQRYRKVFAHHKKISS